MIEIRKSSVSEIEREPNFEALLDEYGAECAIAGMPDPHAKIETYRLLNDAGSLTVFAAFLDDLLVGFITVLYSSILHYSANAAITESFFVSEIHRKTGAGNKLRHAAETYAETAGSPGLFICAPSGGNLASSLAASKKYRETNRIFFWRFANVSN